MSDLVSNPESPDDPRSRGLAAIEKISAAAVSPPTRDELRSSGVLEAIESLVEAFRKLAGVP